MCNIVGGTPFSYPIFFIKNLSPSHDLPILRMIARGDDDDDDTRSRKEKKDQYRCNNMACGRGLETTVCSRCKIVEYCSSECQRKDWYFHQHVCHPSPSARLRGLCSLLSKYKECELISAVPVYVQMDDNDEVFRVSAFARDYTRITGEHNCCAICAKDNVTRPTLRAKQNVKFAGKAWPYFRCITCVKEGRVLCPSTLDNTIDCVIAHREAVFIRVALFTQLEALNKDILDIIVSLCIKMGSCPHCGL